MIFAIIHNLIIFDSCWSMEGWRWSTSTGVRMKCGSHWMRTRTRTTKRMIVMMSQARITNLKETYVPLPSLPLVSPKLDSLWNNLWQICRNCYRTIYLSDANTREWEEFTRILSSTVAACTNKSLPELSFDERGQRPTYSFNISRSTAPHSITTLIKRNTSKLIICTDCLWF